MRRLAPPAALCVLGIWAHASAEPWTVVMEGGAEADSNVKRDGGTTTPIEAAVGRAGARIDHKDRLLDGTYVLRLAGSARMVADDAAKDESVMLYAGEARWMRPVGAQPIALGVGLTATDGFGILVGTGARTFRNLGADVLIALGAGEDRRLVLAFGGRDFWYKPFRKYDWRGPAASARLDVLLWQAKQTTKSLELATTFAFEDRTFDTTAVADVCPPNAPADSKCPAGTSLTRRDRYQRATVELNWVSSVVATVGYQLTVIDSNSYGQSLIRHRAIGSATAELFGKLFGTVTGTLQLDQFPDGVLVTSMMQPQDFTNLEDENRSSLQVLITRKLSPSTTLEARAAMWRDFGITAAAAFNRELVYMGVVYSR